jgi:predicted transglutaminase-like cysteine proteinase
MSIRKRLSFLTAAAALMTSALSHAEAARLADRSDRTSFRSMLEGASALAPFAFIRYCVESPADCRPGGERTLAWSKDNRLLVATINRQVNARIRPVNDSGDVWSADVAAGDCEDFALTKRRALIAAGLPASALRMAVAKTASGEGQAVLLVKTDKGDFVLDNRTDRLWSWRQTDLKFIKIASAEDPRLWKHLLSHRRTFELPFALPSFPWSSRVELKMTMA